MMSVSGVSRRFLVRAAVPRGATRSLGVARLGSAAVCRALLPAASVRRPTRDVRWWSAVPSSPPPEGSKKQAAGSAEPGASGVSPDWPCSVKPDANSSSQSACAAPSDQGAEAEKAPQTSVQKIRAYVQKYGALFVGTYGAIYVGTLGAMYMALESHLLGSGDALSFLHSTHLDQWFDTSLVKPKAGNFMVAWVLTKFTEPVRLAVTIMILPRISRALRLRQEERNEQATAAEASAAESADASSSPSQQSKSAGFVGGQPHRY